MSNLKTLFDKIWDAHVVHRQDDGTCLIYIDRHLVHEVTSPQAFEGLRNAKRAVRAPNRTLAVADHNIPTTDRSAGIEDEESRIQVEALEKNALEFGVPYFAVDDKRQGIVHVIGPEQGFTLPGMTIVCGDSHTATHGAFGALAFGIGTSEVEHVLATQTLIQKPAKNMRISVDGALTDGVTAKDVILAIIGKIGTAAGAPSEELACSGRCPIGRYGTETGASTEDACTTCPAGRFANVSGGVSVEASCHLCSEEGSHPIDPLDGLVLDCHVPKVLSR